MAEATWTCFRLLRHAMPSALALARVNAGSSMAARMAMMAMTTSSSIRVKAGDGRRPGKPSRGTSSDRSVEGAIGYNSKAQRPGSPCACRWNGRPELRIGFDQPEELDGSGDRIIGRTQPVGPGNIDPGPGGEDGSALQMHPGPPQPGKRHVTRNGRAGLEIAERDFGRHGSKCVQRQAIGPCLPNVADMVDPITGFVVRAVDTVLVARPDRAELGNQNRQAVQFASDRIVRELEAR